MTDRAGEGGGKGWCGLEEQANSNKGLVFIFLIGAFQNLVKIFCVLVKIIGRGAKEGWKETSIFHRFINFSLVHKSCGKFAFETLKKKKACDPLKAYLSICGVHSQENRTAQKQSQGFTRKVR